MTKAPEWRGEDGEPLDEWTLTLRKPVKGLDGDLVEELKLREPTAAELVKILDAKAGPASTIVAIQTVTALPDKVVGRISVRDLNRAEAYLTSFFGAAPTGGEES